MPEETPPFVGAYVPSTQAVVLHIPRTLWEHLPREVPEAGALGTLLAAIWGTPGLDAVLGQEAKQAPAPQTEAPAEQQAEEDHADAPA